MSEKKLQEKISRYPADIVWDILQRIYHPIYFNLILLINEAATDVLMFPHVNL